MNLKSERVRKLLEEPEEGDPLVINPRPKIGDGSASVDLRLGTWMMTFRKTRFPYLDVFSSDEDPAAARAKGYAARHPSPHDESFVQEHYVRFGSDFVLHPRSFVLGSTLEWIRLPRYLSGQVLGRSSWGRRGLIIATATGVHPWFSGCLTLEITNLGEVPIILKPGMSICQLFLYEVDPKSATGDKTAFLGKRKPSLGRIHLDEVAKKLASVGSR